MLRINLKEILIYLEQNKESREERIKVENLFMTVDDHLEIQPIYIDLLR